MQRAYSANLTILSDGDYDQHLFYNIILMQNSLQPFIPPHSDSSDFQKALTVLHLLKQSPLRHEDILSTAQSVRSFHQNSPAFQQIVTMISEYLVLQRKNIQLNQLRDSMLQQYEGYL